MVPRTEIIAMEVGSSVGDLQQKFIETGLSKILIYSNTKRFYLVSLNCVSC